MMIKAPKYAVVIDGTPVTEYIYHDVIDMPNTIFGIEESNGVVETIHAYEKGTGKILFKKEKIASHETVDDCLVIALKDGRVYVYFDLERKIRGPYNSIHINHPKSIIIVSKVIKDNNGESKKLCGAYNGDNTLLFPLKYDDINLELDNLIILQHKEQLGLADYDGEILFKPMYDGIDAYFNGNILDLYSKKRETSTLIDEYGDIICVLDTNYSIDADEDLELLFVEKDGKYGIYDDDGFEIFPIALDDYYIDRDVVEIVLKIGKFAYIPKIGKFVDINGYKYTRNGKLKVFDGKRWRTIPN